jgi:hypothetical protein
MTLSEIRRIQNIACEISGVPLKTLLSRARDGATVAARFAAIEICFESAPFKTPKWSHRGPFYDLMGKAFRRCNYQIAYACSEAKNMILTCEGFASFHQKIREATKKVKQKK